MNHRWTRSAFVFCSIAAIVCVWPSRAEAQIPPLQVQIIAMAASDVYGEAQVGEIQANIGIYGVGLAVGLGGEGLTRSDGEYDGGANFHLAIQIRPMMWFAINREYRHPAYHIFDPHLDVGGFLGVLGDSDGADLRAVFYVGGALDFGIPTRFYWMDSQLLISLGYRWVPYQTPTGPEHHVFLGLGWRGGL